MSKDEILELARIYMNNIECGFVFPGELGEQQDDRVEVIFLNPLVLGPDIVMDLADIRVWVNIKTKNVTWIEQM